jgi:hypothetical protein
MRDHVRTNALTRIVLLLAAAAGHAGCGDSATVPSAPSPDPAPSVQVEPRLSGVSLEGPEVVALGETVQFRLMGQLTDGSKRDVTQQAAWTWESVGDQPVSVDGPGLVAARRGGQATIIARVDHHSDSKLVMALPRGTHRLSGYLRDLQGGVNVADARVEVTEGAGAGLWTTTEYHGYYALFGVAGDTRLRISKDGYRTATNRVTVTGNLSHDLRIDPLEPATTLSGVWVLTISAASDCAGRLPEGAGVRTYTARVDQEGAHLLVSLSSTSVDRIAFSGRVEPSRVTFEIFGPSHSEEAPPFADPISGTRALVVVGRASAPLSGSRLDGTMDGRLEVFEAGALAATCESASHRFVMVR